MILPVIDVCKRCAGHCPSCSLGTVKSMAEHQRDADQKLVNEEIDKRDTKIQTLTEALEKILPWAESYIKYLRDNVGPGQGIDADKVFECCRKALEGK